MNIYPKMLLMATVAIGVLIFVSCNSASKNENSAQLNTPEKVVANPNEPIKITVSTSFEPKSVEIKKGQPVKLAFLRQDDKNCGEEVVFPQQNIRKKLPVGETVMVEFTPSESGEIAFTCGMDMMRGKVVVTD